MHSHYQHQPTSYGDLSLSVHERIEKLNRLAYGLAPKVAESAMDSGCTDTRPTGPRSSKAWDLIAEAYSWNAISDTPEALNQAEQFERDGTAYHLEYGDAGFQLVLDTPQPEYTAHEHGTDKRGADALEATSTTPAWVTEADLIKTGDVVEHPTYGQGVATTDAGPNYPAGTIKVMVKIGDRIHRFNQASLTRLVPATRPEGQDAWARILALKTVKDDLGRLPTKALEDEYYQLLADRYDPDGSHGLREPQPKPAGRTDERCSTCNRSAHFPGSGTWHGHPYTPPKPASTTPRDLDQAQHEANQAYLAGNIGVDEWRSALAAIEEERNAQAERLADETNALITELAEKYEIDGVLACGASVDGGRCGRHPHHDGHPHIKEPGTDTEPEPLVATITRQRLRSLPGQPRRSPWLYSYTSPSRQEFRRGDGTPYVIEQGQTVEYGTSLSVLKAWLRRKFAGVKITEQF